MAARQGKSHVVEILIAAGANLHHRDYDEMSALDLAQKYQHNDVVDMLQRSSGKS
jgi:ankyrin repeat protein